MEESMPGLTASVELVNLGVAVTIAWELGRQYRSGTISRTQGHRLLDAVNEIADILEADPHDVWVSYTGEDA